MDLDELLLNLNPQNLPPETIALLVHRVRTAEGELVASQRRESELAALVAERNSALDFLQGRMNELQLQLVLAGVGINTSSQQQPQQQQQQPDESSPQHLAADEQLDDDENDPACQQLYQGMLGLCVTSDRAETMVGNAVRQGRRGSLGRLSSMQGHEQSGSGSGRQQNATGSPFSGSLQTSPILTGVSVSAEGRIESPSLTPVKQHHLHQRAVSARVSAPNTPQLSFGNNNNNGLPPPPCGFVLNNSSQPHSHSTHVSPRRNVGSPGAVIRERVVIGGTHHPGGGSANISKSDQQNQQMQRAVPTPPTFGNAASSQAAPRQERGAREFKRHRAEEDDE